ncbi:MAG: hypothetical protein ABIP78_13460 [Pyrinomonadaceae bacterium]
MPHYLIFDRETVSMDFAYSIQLISASVVFERILNMEKYPVARSFADV